MHDEFEKEFETDRFMLDGDEEEEADGTGEALEDEDEELADLPAVEEEEEI